MPLHSLVTLDLVIDLLSMSFGCSMCSVRVSAFVKPVVLLENCDSMVMSRLCAFLRSLDRVVSFAFDSYAVVMFAVSFFSHVRCRSGLKSQNDTNVMRL